MRNRIAIVGMACEYPDASSPMELFDNGLAGRRAFRQIPAERLSVRDYCSDDPADVDSTYSTTAAVLEGYEFDRERFKVVGSTYRGGDLTHWLALDVADRAFRDAGFEGGHGLPRHSTGVIVGNTLTGEFSRAQAMRLRWPYVRSVLQQQLAEVVAGAGELHALLERIERRYKAPFEEFGDESLAGGLSNTIAGRICNFFDLHGGGKTVDGACASSLLAVSDACRLLCAGELDVALAGGVDLSMDPFELVGFARTGALARDAMRVYDERPTGFWPGEGCGFVVLMREENAPPDRVICCVSGWGVSSDGAGGISRPKVEGQRLALERAYRRAGFGPETLGYFEGHGTGTRIGDETELRALTEVLTAAGARSAVTIGSIKARIGHTKAASGVAGLIHAALSLRQRVVPPTLGCERPHELVDPRRGGLLRVERTGSPWPDDRELRAGVSSMGFGGINVHVVLEGAMESLGVGRAFTARQRALMTTPQDAECFVFGAADGHGLLTQIDALARHASRLSLSDLADVAASLVAGLPDDRAVRAAVVASRPDELAERLGALREMLGSAVDGAQPIPALVGCERGIFLGSGGSVPHIAVLFPGQGAPVYPSLGAIAPHCGGTNGRLAAERFAWAAKDLARAAPAAQVDTAIAQPMIVAASLAGLDVLRDLGLDTEVAVGHSLGELGALAWAGALSSGECIALAQERGRIMSAFALPDGAMASVALSADQAEELLQGIGCAVAAQNGPARSVIAGPRKEIEEHVARARAKVVAAVPLRVSHAFHSPMMEPCVPVWSRALDAVEFSAVRKPIASTVTGDVIPTHADLRSHLVTQLTAPVRFMAAAAHAAKHCDLFVEVGPGQMLTSLVSEFSTKPAVSLDVGSTSVRGLLDTVCAAYVLGAPVKLQSLFEHRVTKTFEVGRALRFLENPCAHPSDEAPAVVQARAPEKRSAAARAHPEIAATPPSESALDVLRRIVAHRCELPVSAIRGSDRFLSDLHLSSIAVSSIAAEAVRLFGRQPLVAPGEFADSTVEELARVIDSDERSLPKPVGVAGVDTWVRAFSVTSVERSRSKPAVQPRPVGAEASWEGFGRPGDEFLRVLLERLRTEVPVGGVVVHLPKRLARENLSLVVRACKLAAAGLATRHFVLVHHGDAAVAIARCLHHEAHSLRTRLIEIPESDPIAVSVERIVEEVRSPSAYVEASYDVRGARCEYRMQVLAEKSAAGDPSGTRPPEYGLPLGAEDVLLVTGGGKGIAAECALALANASGCALGIIGRSQRSENPESDLERNLARMERSGVRIAYQHADVTQPRTLRSAVEAIEAELGPVSGVLHATGLNTPQPLLKLEDEDFLNTLAPKADAFESLMGLLEPERLRCVLVFGSIISRIGLPGESDYAWANEVVSRQLEAYAREHPRTRCLSLEWSIWSGVGMGERLGRVEALAAQNITAISPDDGAAAVVELLSRSDLPARVIVSGRIGGATTLRPLEEPLPLGRFLERVREWTPGVELVVESEISDASDPYLADHVYDGAMLLPGVMGLEAMAQVASALRREQTSPTLERIEFLAPIAVPARETRTIRIAALCAAGGSVRLAIRSDATGFQVDEMRAVARFGAVACAPGPAPVEHDRGRVDLAHDELYRVLFFQRGRFRRVLGYRSLTRFCCEAEIEQRQDAFFSAFHPARLMRGDPGVRDACLHAIQACVPHRDILPVAIDQIVQTGHVAKGTLRCVARERSHENDVYVYDLSLLDGEGSIVERWHGIRLRAVPRKVTRDRWPAALLGPWLESLGGSSSTSSRVRVALTRGTDRRASAEAVALARGEKTRVTYRPDGKPLLESGEHVSLSHCDGRTIAAVAHTPIGVDVEVVSPRSRQEWFEMLGEESFRLAERIAEKGPESLDVAATRVWGVVETLRKLGVQRGAPLVLSEPQSGVEVRFDCGMLTSVTLSASVASTEQASRDWVVSLTASRSQEADGVL